MFNPTPLSTYSSSAPFDVPQNNPYLYGTVAPACSPDDQSLSMAVHSEQQPSTFVPDLCQSALSGGVDPSLEMMFPIPTVFNRANSQSYVANCQPSTNCCSRLSERTRDPIVQPDFATNPGNSFELPAESDESPWHGPSLHYDESTGDWIGSRFIDPDQLEAKEYLDGGAFSYPSHYTSSSRPRASLGRQVLDLQKFCSFQRPSSAVEHVHHPNAITGSHIRDENHVVISTGSSSSPQINSLIVRLPIALLASDTRCARPTTHSSQKNKKCGAYKRSAKQRSVGGDVGNTAILQTTKVIPAILMKNGKVSTEPLNPGHGIREPVPQLKPSGLYYDSLAEARRSVGKPNWMPPPNDNSIPATLDEQAMWVLALRNAMEDMSGYEDNASGRMRLRWLDLEQDQGQERKNDDTLTNPYYPRHWLEEKCWETVDMCTRLHQSGPSILRSCNPSFLEASFATKNLTFKERMNMMIECALRCKNRVGDLIGGGMTEKYLITAPKLVKETMVNRDNNVRRQVFILDGRPQVDASNKRRSRKPKKPKPAAQAEAMEQKVSSDPKNSETKQQPSVMVRYDQAALECAPQGHGIMPDKVEELTATLLSPQASKIKRKRGPAENAGRSIKRTRDLDGKSKIATAHNLRNHKA